MHRPCRGACHRGSVAGLRALLPEKSLTYEPRTADGSKHRGHDREAWPSTRREPRRHRAIWRLDRGATMTLRVREILSWYGADNAGTLTNLARLLNHGRLAGTGKLVILPVDQGFEHGPARSFAPNPPAYNPLYHFELAVE